MISLDSLNPLQQLAATTALSPSNPITIITGGPGVGKTFTARYIVENLLSSGHRVALCAPTGKAAKRLSEVSTYRATTIHRLLEPIMSPSGDFIFSRDERNPLDQTAILIDETSMVDVPLMSSLSRALPHSCKLIILGDVDQLPAVGPGNVLRDMIVSKRIPVIRLTEIVRQAAGSFIIRNAHAINRGQMPRQVEGAPGERETFNLYATKRKLEELNADFFMIKEVNEETVAKMTVEIASLSDAQILVPMHKPVVGTKNLNKLMQNAVNPVRGGMRLMDYGKEVQWREGDKVMNLTNDSERGIYNGDIGSIISIDQNTGIVECEFEDALAEIDDIGSEKKKFIRCKFSKQDLSQLTHAWAITIHKSQGSEWDNVVIPLHQSHTIMLQRNLLYTALTRGKKMVWLIGSERSIGQAVRVARSEDRRTTLKGWLEKEIEEVKEKIEGEEQEEFFGEMR